MTHNQMHQLQFVQVKTELEIFTIYAMSFRCKLLSLYHLLVSCLLYDSYSCAIYKVPKD